LPPGFAAMSAKKAFAWLTLFGALWSCQSMIT